MKNYIKPQMDIENTLVFSENIAGTQAGLGSWLNERGLESATEYDISSYISAS